MPVICDDCDDEISLAEATDCGEAVLCAACFADWEDDEDDDDDEPPAVLCACSKCRKVIRRSDLSEKLEGQLLCPKCAHTYELKIFTPPDHSAAECQLCTAH